KMTIKPDKASACTLKFRNGVQVQMEMDPRGENLLIISNLGSILSGRYRENLFREALKANGLAPPRYGIFAFGKKNDALVLFDSLLLDELTGQKLADFLLSFTQKAELWKTGIDRGEVPSFLGNELPSGKGPSSGMFGLA